MRRVALACTLLCAACGGGCGASAETPAVAASSGPTRLSPGLGDEAAAADPASSGSGPTRVEEEAVEPPPVEPPP